MKTQLPWINRAKGSAGGMTACKVYDKNVFRAKPYEVSNPKTQKQTTQRDFFKEVSALVATFTDEQLRTLYPSAPKGMSRRNALSQLLTSYFSVSGTTKSVDYANIDTLGNAKRMDFGQVTCTNNDGTITVALSASVAANAELADFYFIAAIVNSTKKEILLTTTSAKVENQSISLSAPSGWATADTIHAIPLITDSTTAVTSFGSFIIKERPEPKGRNTNNH